MHAAADQSSAVSGARRIRSRPTRPALSCPRLLLVRLADLRSVALGLALALNDLHGAAASVANADWRLLLLRFDYRQAHLALVLAFGRVDHNGRAGGKLLAQHEVRE